MSSITNPNTTLSSLDPAENAHSLAGKVWNFLTNPSQQIAEPDKRQQARFLSGFLVFIVPLVIVILMFGATTSGTGTVLVGRLIVVGVPVGIYFLSRTKYIDLATGLFVLTTIIDLLIVYVTNAGNASILTYLIVPVLISGLLLSLRTTIAVIALNLVLLLLADASAPDPELVRSQIYFNVVFSGLVLIFVPFRNFLESTRKAQVTAALEEVEKVNQTLSVTNQDLIRANAVAKEAARLKSEFMATMSHELRTPLNAMLGFSGILLEGMGGEFDDETRHMIYRIEQNSKRLLTLINDVLDIAKIEAGRLEIVSTVISPPKLVEAWRSQMGVLAEQKNLDFITEIDPRLPDQLYGDSERITQVAINLLSNAFKFTEAGSVKLRMRPDGSTWLIEVTDTGIGIPPHAINYIFDEFRQLDGSSKRSYGGTGLGLAIVRNLCRMMGGTISVTSKLGEGSTFTVTLPLNLTPTADAVPLAETR